MRGKKCEKVITSAARPSGAPDSAECVWARVVCSTICSRASLSPVIHCHTCAEIRATPLRDGVGARLDSGFGYEMRLREAHRVVVHRPLAELVEEARAGSWVVVVEGV